MPVGLLYIPVLYGTMGIPIILIIPYTYKFSRDVANFRRFRGELAICEIFIHEISLANFDLHESESRVLGDPQK